MGEPIWINGLVHGLTALGTAVTIALFQKLFPPPPADDREPPITEDEARVYRRWQVAAIVPIFVIATAGGFGWFLAIEEVSRRIVPETPGTILLLRPIRLYWAIPALFLGIVSAAPVMDLSYKLLLGHRYRRYLRFCDNRAGYDGRRLFRWLASIFLIGSAALVLIGFRSFTRFDAHGVEIARPFAAGTVRYGYARVRGLERRATFRAPNGNRIDRPYYVVTFDDGSTWTTRDGLRDPDPPVDDRVAQLVSKKSGRPIVERP